MKQNFLKETTKTIDMSTLCERINQLYITSVGNRVTALGYITLAGGTVMLIEQQPTDPLAAVIGVGMTLGFGGFCILATAAGCHTNEYYLRTKDHIKENGKFDDRFLKVTLEKKKGTVTYCIRQGVYLAAKETGHLDQFNEAKAKYSHGTLPNF